MYDKYCRDSAEPVSSSNEVLDYAKTAGFGPEAHDDDPTANTKMVI